MKSSLFLLLVALLTFTVSCNRDNDSAFERQSEEAVDEIGHEADEMGDNLEDAGEELRD